jgi:uncharacterized protein YqeY
MELIEKLKADRIVAMKSGKKDQMNLLSSIISELDFIRTMPDFVGKTLTDNDVIKVIKKMIESSEACHQEEDAKFLNDTYMPKQLNEFELNAIIYAFCKKADITSKKNMGEVMKYLKETYPLLYDGKLASQIVNNILK